MQTLTLERHSYLPFMTLGTLRQSGENTRVIHTLEPPWLNNQKNKSCIPEGTYDLIAHTSKKFGECALLLHVPKRSEILIHAGNMVCETRGCILVGLYQDMGSNGFILKDSRQALATVLHRLRDTQPTQLIITQYRPKYEIL